MTERGGPTAQAGILYQNSISALYMGRLCDDTPRPAHEIVTSVRVEAPSSVDDTVVEFADGHLEYIQAKTNVGQNHDAWEQLWRDFDAEYHDPNFQRHRDRLRLLIEREREEHRALEGLYERAKRGPIYSEWWSGLNQNQQALVRRIEPLLANKLKHDDETRQEAEAQDDDALRREAERLSREGLVAFFGLVDVEPLSLKQIERYAVESRMPQTDKPRMTLFRLLRDRVGGEARYRGVFTRDALREALAAEDNVHFVAQPDIDELRTAVSACSALLLQHKHTFGTTRRHLSRAVTGEIAAWGCETSDDGAVAVLLDRAGMGKTVVMGDVLRLLEADDVTVLGIKSDQQLSGVVTHADLREKLDLPDNVDRVVDRLAAHGRVVVLVDQIDALSLTLSRDQKALDVMLDTVARLRRISNVRVLVSCRAFDLNNDPKLRRVEVQRRFSVPELTSEEVADVLRGQGIEIDALSPVTQQLLRVPLHLDLFLRITHGREVALGPRQRASNIRTLQDLYTMLWDEVILTARPDAPPWHDRVEIVRLLTDYMNREQSTTAPQAVFSRPATRHLEAAWHWLASAGIVVRRNARLSFMHQTFFDYCYARQFVEDGGSLSRTILAGDQGLLARRQLVQILAFLRGTDVRAYVGELRVLINAEVLRPHLKSLLFSWFGTLPDPTDEEWSLARRLLINPATRTTLLKAMQGSCGWFARLEGGALRELLALDDEALDADILPYLVSMVDPEQEAVVRLLRPFVGRSDRWNERVMGTLSRIRNWHALAAVDLYEQVLRELPPTAVERLYALDDSVIAFPREGCRLIRLTLDRALDAYLADDTSRLPYYRGLLGGMPLNDYALQRALEAASETEPEAFVESLLPWVERAVGLTEVDEYDWPYFASDGLSHGWYDGLEPMQTSFVEAMVRALTTLAEEDPDHFRGIADRLVRLPYQTPQQLLAHVYRAVPATYAGDALRFLLGDRRRLNLGDHEQYDSRTLITAIYRFLDREQQVDLEAYILSWNVIRKHYGKDALKFRGLEQLYLLQAVPAEQVTERGAKYLRELERKFRGLRASEEPVRTFASFVGPPIPEEAQARMSDEAWLCAMQKYSGEVRHQDFHKGGAYELSSGLQRQVQANPERFYRLVWRVPLDVDDNYVGAFIQGLADSDAPKEWLFEVVDRFADQAGRHIKRIIAWALEKRAHQGLSARMMDLLETTVRGPLGDDEMNWQKNGSGPHGDYLNSDRGASLRTLMQALGEQANHAGKTRMWELIEYAATDSSTALRAGAIEELLYRLLEEDRDRAVGLFERLMCGHPKLLCDRNVAEFLYWGAFKRFSRTEPFVRTMMENQDDGCSQAGARLACVAAISAPSAVGSDAEVANARALAASAVNGNAALRRGAAQVYAANIESPKSAVCARQLTRLRNDDDDEVRRLVASAFSRMHGVQEPETRRFVERFATSRALAASGNDFAEFLWQVGPDEPRWALQMVETVLDNPHVAQRSVHRTGGEELIRLVLRVYNDSTVNDALRERAMNAFDRLTEEYAYEAQSVLDEWDQR